MRYQNECGILRRSQPTTLLLFRFLQRLLPRFCFLYSVKLLPRPALRIPPDTVGVDEAVDMRVLVVSERVDPVGADLGRIDEDVDLGNRRLYVSGRWKKVSGSRQYTLLGCGTNSVCPGCRYCACKKELSAERPDRQTITRHAHPAMPTQSSKMASLTWQLRCLIA